MTDPIRPELISMPEDVMRFIMGECDFISIQRLRKTCHDLRNFINLTKPKYHFKTIEMAGDLQGMLLHFSEEDSFDLRYPNGQKISICYEKIDKESTKIQWYREDKICTKIIENSNFIDFVCRDFESIVNRNSKIFETLSINLEQMGHNFLNSPSITKIISISFNRFNDEDRLIESLGQPYQRYQRYQPLFEWFFRRPDDNVLFIEYSGSHFDCIIQPLDQRLRSTCRAFQNFIDRKKPSYHFKYITINGSQKEVFLAFSEENEFEDWYPNGQKIIMVYKKIDEESTKIDWMRDDGERIKIIGNSNFMDLFCRDLGHILDRNTTNFNLLSIDSQNYRFYVNIQKVLESCGKTPIKVHTLAIENSMCQENVLEILRYICLDTIERLEIHCPGCRWDISKIVKSDHWKNAKELEMSGLPVRAGIQNYEHFEDANFCLEEGTVDDVISVKENFLNSPSTTKHFEIMFENFPDEERLIGSFGQPYREPDDFQPAEQKSCQRLRSTCRAFQNLIDRKKPSYHFKYIKIRGTQKEMSLTFSAKDESEEWYPNGPKIYMVYQKIDEESTKIHWIREDEDRTKIISNFNFFNLFSRDLGPILDRNSATLDKMLIDLPVFEDREMYFKRIFESCRKPPIKVHTLLIAFATCQEDVLGILPFTFSDTLKILKIGGPGRRCDISRILQLDHWKKLEEVVMRRMSVQAGIQNYDHFEDAVISLEQVTRDDAIRVKENFLNSPSTTKYLQIYFNRFPDQDLLIESFGQFYPEPDEGVQRAPHKSWFFRRPDDYVVFLVVEYYEFLKERFRRTCHTVRNFIDDNKPKLSINDIQIFHYPKQITLVCGTYVAWQKYPFGKKIELTYQKIDEESTKIIWHRSDRDREKIIRNENYVDVFSRDFGYVLACNLKILNLFHVICMGYELEDIRKAFESSGNVPIKVETLNIRKAKCVENLLDVLPYFCPDTLDCLDIERIRPQQFICFYFDRRTCGTWDITKLMELEQWKKMKELVMSQIPVRPGIQNFDHFEIAEIRFEEVTMNDVIMVKKNFLNSPSTKKRLEIFFDNFPEKKGLAVSLGQPYEDPRNRNKCWFFRRSDTHVLCIRFTYCSIEFRIEILADVPRGAVTYDNAWELYPGKQIIRLKYRKIDGEPPKIIWERRDKPREKIIEDEEFTDAFSRDFDLILACKLPVLDQFSVLNKGYGLEDIWKALKSSVRTPIKVHTLLMGDATCVENVLDVLPYMCPETIHCLDITFARGTYHTWNIKKMVKLEQWRNLKELEMGRIPVRGAGIQSFEHFETADIRFEKVTMNDLIKVKENFLNWPSTTKSLKFVAEDSFPEDHQLNESLGQPFDHPYKKKSWFFRRSDKYVLFIELYRRRFYDFCIKTLRDVPEGAEVIG
ncbi:hypothetical protein CAEBREN_16701 [Caenorhabditis brenneri]|uniref:F-box domain-containing protein n=1 Tax=Caenorhabditis brenneri TaxID=135651 RepID=G0N1I2_CAEBE|nr:hypothetical protein CAEBREN_16701 [Caenorhabditis brenneri]